MVRLCHQMVIWKASNPQYSQPEALPKQQSREGQRRGYPESLRLLLESLSPWKLHVKEEKRKEKRKITSMNVELSLII